MDMPTVPIPPNTHASEAALIQHVTAAPFIRAIDDLNPAIPIEHRQCIVMLASGVSMRLIAEDIPCSLASVLTWSRMYRKEVEALKGTVTRIAVELIGGLIGDLVMIGYAAMPSLHARAKAGKMDGRELLCAMNAAQACYDLAQRIESSNQPRRGDRALTASREDALAAIKSLKQS